MALYLPRPDVRATHEINSKYESNKRKSKCPHQAPKTRIAHKFANKSCFQLTSSVVISRVAFQYFIQSLENESPESINRPVIYNLVKDMCDPMKIGLYMLAVDLP
jgi:hypothetical protein